MRKQKMQKESNIGLMPVKLAENSPLVNAVVQESRELYYSSLNTQMDAPFTGKTGVEVANTPAIYIQDRRINLCHEGFTRPGIPTSGSWVTNRHEIERLVEKFQPVSFMNYTDREREVTYSHILADKILGCSLWILTMAAMHHEAAKFNELRMNPDRFADMEVDDEMFEGPVFMMSQATWARAQLWLDEKTKNIKEEMGHLYGVYKPFVDAFIFNYRAYSMTNSYVNIERQQKRVRYVMPGMANAVVRYIHEEDGTVEDNILINGLFSMDALYEWIMNDMDAFHEVVKIRERGVSDKPNDRLSWLVENPDPINLGTGMFKSIRKLERNRNEPLFYEYAKRVILDPSHGSSDEREVYFLQHDLVHKWFGTKPTWFAFVQQLTTVDGDIVHACIFQNYSLDPGYSDRASCLTLGARASGGSYANVYVLTYKQVDAPIGTPNVLEALLWAPAGDVMYYAPYMYAVTGAETVADLYAIDPLDMVSAHTSKAGDMFRYEIEDTDLNLMQAKVPTPMTYNLHYFNGHRNYIEHYVRGTLGSFPGNVYARNYIVSGMVAKQLPRGVKRKSNRTGDKVKSLGSTVVPEDTVDYPDVKPKSNWIPKEKWDKMSPEERREAKKGGS